VSASKAIDLSRRQLFRGDLSGKRVPIRPPWGVSEAIFATSCDRCSDCVRACPERLIRSGSGGFPEMSFESRGCSLCGDCVSACGGKALKGDPAQDRPWDLIAEIADGCLALRGVVCRSCGEACAEAAIRFRLRVGGAAEPLLDRDACTGCGSCVGVCPVQAVAMIAGESHNGSAVKAEGRAK
jgi:ferredoxin-type protein NapF